MHMIEKKQARRDGRRAAGRGTWAGDKPVCGHCTTAHAGAQARVVCEVRGANRPAAHPAEPVAAQLPLPMEVAS